MAAVTSGVGLTSSSNTNIYTTGSFTPALNDLLVAVVGVTATTDAGAMTDSLGGTWTQIGTATKNGSADKLWIFIRDTLAPNSSMTVSMDVTGDDGNGCAMVVFRVSGMTRTGASASKQFTSQSDQAGGGTPTATFSGSCLTGNPTIGMVLNAANPAAVTHPAGWTEERDSGYNTPTTGIETVFRDSGFTGTTITWGGTSGSAFGVVAIELDTSVAADPFFTQLDAAYI